jgi:hypothetical protein
MSDKLQEFNQEIIEEVMEYRNNNVVTTSVAFKTIFLSYLNEIGETSIADCQIIDFKKTADKVKVDGYVFSQYFNTLTLLISDFSQNPTVDKMGKTDIDKVIKQGLRFYKNCFTNYFDDIEESSDGFQAYEYIEACKDEIETIEIVLITNKRAVLYVPEDTKIGKANIKYDVWDIERLYQHIFMNISADSIDIKLNKKYNTVLPLIKVETANDVYDCYIGYISGELLAKIYNDEGQKLIEKNVRSFLQATGKINRGIRDSLLHAPEMFMAYNNGISTIADEIEIDENVSNDYSVVIKSITGWQIVNGGQTTASIYNVYKNKTDLSKVSVQMKLTVIKSQDKTNEVIANISRYANSQNPIKMSDFNANDDYHINMERYSRIVYIPVEKGKSLDRWFYERARGQYFVEVNRQLTPALKRNFKEHNPKKRCISKAVAAKCMMCWMGYPSIVSKGLETNFVYFTQLMSEGEIPEATEENFKRMIAQVILFNKCDSIIANHRFGGFKAQQVYYTMALLGKYHLNMIDFLYIWNHQDITANLGLVIEDVIYKVWNHFQKPTIEGVNIGQWCKKDECWDLIQKRFENNEL